MTILNKLLLAALGLVLVAFGFFVIWKEHQITQMQTQLSQSVVAMQQLQDNITRSQVQIATKADLAALAAANQVDLSAIESNLSSLQASLTGINVVSVNSAGENTGSLPSTSTTPTVIPTTTITGSTSAPTIVATSSLTDPFGYLANTQNLSLAEQFGTTSVPIGQVSFSASQKAPWSIDLFPRKYNVVNVLGTNNDNSHYVYNKFTINANGKDYPITINNAQYEEELPAPSFSFWNPRLFFAASAAINISELPLKGDFIPGVSLGIMSYGKTKSTPSISVLQVGVGYATVNRAATVSLSPINFNIGELINTSLINNTFVGPTIQLSSKGDIMTGVGFTVGF